MLYNHYLAQMIVLEPFKTLLNGQESLSDYGALLRSLVSRRLKRELVLWFRNYLVSRAPFCGLILF
jgi:hypothetical protein